MAGKKQPLHQMIIEVTRILPCVCIHDEHAMAGARAVLAHLLRNGVIPADHDELASALYDTWPDNDLRDQVLAAVRAEKARVEREKANAQAQADEGFDGGTDGMTAPERHAILGLYGIPTCGNS